MQPQIAVDGEDSVLGESQEPFQMKLPSGKDRGGQRVCLGQR